MTTTSQTQAQHLLCTNRCSKCLPCICSFYPHNHPVTWGFLLSSFYIWAGWGTESSCHLAKDPQLGSQNVSSAYRNPGPLNQIPWHQMALNVPRLQWKGRIILVQASLGSKCPHSHMGAWAAGAAGGTVHEEWATCGWSPAGHGWAAAAGAANWGWAGTPGPEPCPGGPGEGQGEGQEGGFPFLVLRREVPHSTDIGRNLRMSRLNGSWEIIRFSRWANRLPEVNWVARSHTAHLETVDETPRCFCTQSHLATTCCVSLGKSLDLSEPQFLPL